MGAIEGHAVERIRVLLVDMPQLLREIVGAIVGDAPDLEVVAEIPETSLLRQEVDRHRPDFVILGTEGSEPAIGSLLVDYPRVRALAVASDGRASFLYELRARRSLGEISPAALLNAIRTKSRDGAESDP